MKKVLVIVLMCVMGIAQYGFSQISGTAHDLKGEAWNAAGTNRICGSCHTPHNGSAVVTDAPLWNHAVTAAAHTEYSGTGTLNAVVGAPSGVSKLCLSCHDGTVGVDNFAPINGATMMVGAGLVGTDLSNDHPVSFTYDDALATADGGLYPPTTTAALGGFITTKMLFSNKMECASCHDVHDDTNGKFLIMSNTDSELCLTCHSK